MLKNRIQERARRQFKRDLGKSKDLTFKDQIYYDGPEIDELEDDEI